jgi:DSF synthase
MNAIVDASVLANRSPSHIVEHPNGTLDIEISKQFSCNYDRQSGALWSTWAPKGIPCFNMELLHDLERGSQLIESHFSENAETSPLHYIVLRSAVPQVFNVGGDLGYFQRLISVRDRAGLTEYARTAIDVQYRNYTAHNLRGVTTFALLEGDALGGGFESALSCEVIVAEKHVKAGFPEVLFNMFPGMGGMSFLARRVGRRVADEMVRTGRMYSAVELHELGVIDHLVDTGSGAAEIKKIMRQREHKHSAHNAMNLVDRMLRPVGLQELHDVVRLWVDCALGLDPRSLEWMQRLFQRQLAIFGQPLSVAVEQRAQLAIAA